MAFETISDYVSGDKIPFTNTYSSYIDESKTRLKDQVYDPLAPFLPMKPYSFHHLNVKRGWRERGDWYYDWSDRTRKQTPVYQSDYVLTASVNPLAPNIAEQEQIAIHNMYKKLSRQKMQAMVSFIERRKTANMILDRSKSVAQLIYSLWRLDFPSVIKSLGLSRSHLRSRNAKRARRFRQAYRRKNNGDLPDIRSLPSEPRVREAIGNVSGFYMEIRYGFRPLLGDIDDAMTALADIPHPSYFNVTGGNTQELIVKDDQDWGLDNWYHRRSKVKQTVKASVTVKSSCDFANFVTKYGLDDVFSTAYEAIPLSWMLDWVYPVGQYLKNVNAVSGLVVQQYCTTQFLEFESSAKFDSPDTYPHYGSSSEATSKGVRMNRSVGGLPPVPLPVFKLEGLAKPWHIADAIGLLTSAIFGPKGQTRKYRI